MKEKKYMNLQKHKRVIISGGGPEDIFSRLFPLPML